MDRELKIAFGSSRVSKMWANRRITFEALCERLKTVIRTSESTEDYPKLPKDERDSIKDKGGLVGGYLKEGRRKADHVLCRSIATHDVDSPDPDFLSRYRGQHRFASVLYSTHSHTPQHPRYRVFTPFTRDVTPEEYEAIARYLAAEMGIACVDPCSYQVHQLMYWPTTPTDGEYVYERFDGEWLNPDAYLAEHPDWRNAATLPTAPKESVFVRRDMHRQKDPLEKEGVIGAFNHVFFPIQRLLETELSDVYEPAAVDGRYTHIGSSGSAGAVIYEDRFLYSHHATDPAYGKLLSAFDLMRVHRFGDMDTKESLKNAVAYAASIPEVKQYLSQHLRKNAQAEDSSTSSEDDAEWKRHLAFEPRSGKLANTLQNIILILQNDPALRDIVFNLLADSMEIRGSVPWKHPTRFWRDADDAQLVSYVDSNYGQFSARNYDIAVTKVVDDRSYHPILEYLESLPPWDGECRVDTLLTDYLGAEDTPLHRAFIRKILCAAIRRVKRPGTKFDYVLVLNGPQGKGKSTFISKLGGEWFADSLTLSDMNDKTAAEKLQGFWIHEISEMAGMKKADLEKVKSFVARCDDKYRASFGRRVSPHPRQCVFFGTTNAENGYLRDITGNRRFWNVHVTGEGKYRSWDMTQETIDQIWAEAMLYEEQGEKLYLPPELESAAAECQRDAMERDEREGLVLSYLNAMLPDHWNSMEIYERISYLTDKDPLIKAKGVSRRTQVSNIEIWCECFGKRKEDMQPRDSYAIAAIMTRIPGWTKSEHLMHIPIYGRQRVYTRE